VPRYRFVNSGKAGQDVQKLNLKISEAERIAISEKRPKKKKGKKSSKIERSRLKIKLSRTKIPPRGQLNGPLDSAGLSEKGRTEESGQLKDFI